MRLLRDLTLSHVLSRDQVIELGYFGSVTRTNTRLRELRELGLVRTLDTPFFAQRLYAVSATASEVVGPRIAPLTATRTGSPRFLQHALSVTNTRIVLLGRGGERWLFEQQARTTFTFGGKDWDVRPDGIAVEKGTHLPVEVDLGHVAPAKFKEKLASYHAFVESGTSEGLVRSRDEVSAREAAHGRMHSCGHSLVFEEQVL